MSKGNRIWKTIFAAACLPLLAPAAAGQSMRLTLEEALEMAMTRNRTVRLAMAGSGEQKEREAAARANYFPRLTTEATYLRLTERQRIALPAGALGVFDSTGPVPGSDLVIDQGSRNLFYTINTLSQPLTQLLKIHQNHRAVQAGRMASEQELRKARNQIACSVRQLYFGLLSAREHHRAMQARLAASRERLRDAEQARAAGSALPAAVMAREAEAAEAALALAKLEDQMEDLAAELCDLLGIASGTVLDLAPPPAAPALASREEYIDAAMTHNPEIRHAEHMVEKARAAFSAARAAYIPDISAFAQYAHQNGVPLLPGNNWSAGLKLEYTLFDAGKRRHEAAAQQFALQQAEQDRERVKGRVRVEVEKAWRKARHARQQVELARLALAACREAERVASDQYGESVIVLAALRESQASTARAEADLRQAELSYQLALAELDRIVGREAR